jgi:hypothetical protein
MSNTDKFPVSPRSLLQRLNRNLQCESRGVHAPRRGRQAHKSLGDYYLVDTRTETIVAHHVDLEQMARERGVMKAFEELM